MEVRKVSRASVIEDIKTLSRKDKVEVNRFLDVDLYGTFDEYRDKINTRFRSCEKVMSQLTGINVLEDTRRRDVVIARDIIAYTLLQEGFYSVAVGEVLKRDHATVLHMRNKIWNVLDCPECYRWEYELLTRFREELYADK